MKKVRETLSTLENVQKVDVDFAKKTATITMKGEAKLEQDAVTKSLKDKGFEVTKFEKKS